METLFAACPQCKAGLPVVIGRKLTVRRVTCDCGARYEYSAWRLRVEQKEGGLRTFYQVDIFPV